MRILIIIVLLSFTTIASADLIVKGKRTIYTGDALTSGVTLTESEVAPTNPATNDIWRNITDGTIYVYNGTIWIVKNKTADIQTEIDIFKANIGNVSDVATRKCLKSLAVIILKLYKE